jgi:hypothetical protein
MTDDFTPIMGDRRGVRAVCELNCEFPLGPGDSHVWCAIKAWARRRDYRVQWCGSPHGRYRIALRTPRSPEVIETVEYDEIRGRWVDPRP